VAVPAIPRTLTGKKLELPVKRILTGAPVSEVASRDALADPDSIQPFADYARTRAQPDPGLGPLVRSTGERYFAA